MNQTELNRAVAKATGETPDLISRRGFSPLLPLECEHEPQTVDWDELDEGRVFQLTPRRRRTPIAV